MLPYMFEDQDERDRFEDALKVHLRHAGSFQRIEQSPSRYADTFVQLRWEGWWLHTLAGQCQQE